MCDAVVDTITSLGGIAVIVVLPNGIEQLFEQLEDHLSLNDDAKIPVIAITVQDYRVLKNVLYDMLEPPTVIPYPEQQLVEAERIANISTPLRLNLFEPRTTLIESPFAPRRYQRLYGIIDSNRVGAGLLSTYRHQIVESIPDRIDNMCQYYVRDPEYRRQQKRLLLSGKLRQSSQIPSACKLENL